MKRISDLEVVCLFCLSAIFCVLPNVSFSQSIDSSKWVLGISGGPTYEFREVRLMKGTSASNEDALEVNTHQAKTGFITGFQVSKRIHKSGFYLSTGFAYEDKGYTSNKVDTAGWYDMINPRTGELVFVPEKSTYREEYVYRSYSIPLELVYRHSFGRLALTASAGVLYELPTYTRTYTYWKSLYGGTQTEDISASSHYYNLGWKLNLGVGYRISKHFGLYVQPGFAQDIYYKDLVGDTTVNDVAVHGYLPHHYLYRLYSVTYPISFVWSI